MLEKDTYLKGRKVYQTRLSRKQFKKAFPQLKNLKAKEVRVEWREESGEFIVSHWLAGSWKIVLEGIRGRK
jgi:hypothetical protein